MIENHYLAGLVAGIPVSLLCLAYLLLRRDAVVEVFSSGDRAFGLLMPGLIPGQA